MFAFRATFRRWGPTLDQRLHNMAIRNNLILTSATFYEVKRAHAGKLIYQMLFGLVSNDKMLKRFLKF